MTNNKQQTSVEWYLDQLIEHRIIIVDKTTYQVKYKHEILLEQAKEMHQEEIDQSYRDGFEFALINECAEQSTSEASKYAEGYKEGYKRACDYMTDTIKNKIEIKENGSNTFSTSATTTTTRLCPVFVPNEFVGQHRCKNCGNERHQHTTPTNTP